jgi:TrmH family RNA methyltransferase
MVMECIRSRQNPKIKHLLQLRKADVRRKFGKFLIEGIRESMRALQNSIEIVDVFISESSLSYLRNFHEQISTHIVSRDIFEKISARENPDGILCIAKIPKMTLPETLPPNALIVVVERIEKPGNLGALIRTIESAGCNLLIIADQLTDLWNQHVIRSSQGALFAMQSIVTTNGEALSFLRMHNATIVATVPSAKQTYWCVLPTTAIAVVAGNEHNGLSDFWVQNSDIKISIPMCGSTSDSLNVNVATALVLYEALRVRKYEQNFRVGMLQNDQR